MKIKQIRAGMRNLAIDGVVMEKPAEKRREVMTKMGPMSVADVLIADDSGEITLTLWNEQIEKLALADRIELKNVYINTFKGKNSVNIGKFGTLIVNGGQQ